jgi:hypothetical protein
MNFMITVGLGILIDVVATHYALFFALPFLDSSSAKLLRANCAFSLVMHSFLFKLSEYSLGR